MKQFIASLLCCLGLPAVHATAQTVDTSGNGMLKGNYFVRQVLLSGVDQTTSAVQRARSLSGTMTFDGKGGYSFTGQLMDSQQSQPQSYSITGAYTVGSNGLTEIQNPIDTTDTDFGSLGAIGPSAIVASATEGPYFDIFVGIPSGSGASNGSLMGAYRVGFIDFLQANASLVRDGYFTLNSTGNGNLGAVTVNGAMANQGSANTSQTYGGVTYSLNGNGSGAITFPVSFNPGATLLSGQKNFYISADGNVLLAGAATGFDIEIGVRAFSGAAPNSAFQSTYFLAALENDASDLANGNNSIDSFSGSLNSAGNGTSIAHFRLAPFNSPTYDYTFDIHTNFGADGTIQRDLFQYILGANAQSLLVVGRGSFYSLQASFQAPPFSGPGVFLNPIAIVNSGNFAPITNSVAPLEFVSAFGTGLSPTILQAPSLPLQNNLAGVQFLANGRPSPMLYVSSTLVSALVPSATSEPYVTFQVINNGVPSNKVTVYRGNTSPGVLTLNQAGAGPAALLHPDYSAVNSNSPATPGETLMLYLTGLGSVTPAVPDGAATPDSPPTTVDADVIVELQDPQSGNFYPCTVGFKGLASGSAALYQVNFTLPKNVPSGTLYLNVGTPDAYTSEATINVLSPGAQIESAQPQVAGHARPGRSRRPR